MRFEVLLNVQDAMLCRLSGSQCLEGSKDSLMYVTTILSEVKKQLPNDTAPLPIRLETFAEEFLVFCGIWQYLPFSQNVPYSVTGSYLLLFWDLWGSRVVLILCWGSCLFAFVFSAFPLSWGMKQHNRYDDKALGWTTEKLILFLREAISFPLLHKMHTLSGIHPVPPRALSPWVKWSGLEADHSCLEPRLRTTGAIPPLPHMP